MPDLQDLLGQSAAIEGVRETIRRLLGRQQGGRRPPAILLQGETGTGKGLVARMIHRMGPRARGPFVDVNCAAIPETLIEAELFGYERGAFTDARRAKPGLFQTAHHGTIFLDEVGLLPEALQAKLLTVIEERAVRRLGGTQPEPADAWVLSATNADLPTAIRAGRFREDLYHRLAVLTLRLPPLRERGRDVILLAEHLLAHVCAEYGLPSKKLSPEAEARLLAHPWPGNVRELGNVLERVALLTDGPVVTADLLELPSAASSISLPAAPPGPPSTSLDDAVRQHLRATLVQTGWNISRTATLLGITRNTVRARIEKFDLHPDRGGEPTSRRAPGTPAPSRAIPEPIPAGPSETPVSPAAVSTTIRWEPRRITLLRATLVAPGSGEPSDAGRALDVLVEKLRSFGGRIDQLAPTMVGAVFGLEPVEDAPRRAAHAAMAMQKAAERTRRSNTDPFSVKIGIHVGQVTVGSLGPDLQIEADAKRGEWEFLAQLLMAAPIDSIVISPAAVPFLQRRFDLEPDEASAQPMYRVRGRERRGLGLEGEMTGFVGRRQELDLLKSRLPTARGGRGQIVSLVGEAGIGKSRLLYEFRQALRGEAVTYIQAHCLSYATTIPYLPVLELLRAACLIRDADPPATVTSKLRRTLLRLGIEPDGALPYLLQFIGIKDGTDALAGGTPEAIQARTSDVLRQMCINASRQRPLIIAVEDVHWIDAASEALAGLIGSAESIPLLLVVSYRPGYWPLWLERASITQIGLQPLSPENSLSILAGFLPADRLSDPLCQLIFSKADGNPFFLEELARTVREQGDLSPVVSVPDTIQEVLLARINRLPERERRLLQSAAVIDKNVFVDVLRAVTDISPDDLLSALNHLRTADFLYEMSIGVETQYSFKHALTHEVAYESLDPRRRRDLHARIVSATEALYSDRLGEHVERLAHHATRGALWEKAVTYLRRAGLKAAARSAHHQAVAYFEQALESLPGTPERSDRIQQDIDLRFDLRNSLQALGDLASILDHLRVAERLAKELADQRRLAQVFSFMSQYFRLMGDVDQAIESGRSALALAQQMNDLPLAIVANERLGPAHAAAGDYRQGAAVLKETVQALGSRPVDEVMGTAGLLSVFSRVYLLGCLVELGEFEEAAAYGEQAMKIAETVDHLYSRLFAYYGAGTLALCRGDVERAIPVLEQGFSGCEASHVPLMLPLLGASLGTAYTLAGRLGEAIFLLERTVREGVAMQRMGGHSILVVRLGEAYLKAGRAADALDSAEHAVRLAGEHKERGHEAYALRLLGDVASQDKPVDVERAENFYGQAAAVSEQLGMRPLQAHCQLGFGRLYLRSGRPDPARRSLLTAEASYRTLGMSFWRNLAQEDLDSPTY